MTESISDRALKRSAFFSGIAQLHIKQFETLRQTTHYRADAPLILAHAYFLLSDAYKDTRNQSTLTDDYKKAALSAVTVMVLRPFEPFDPLNVNDELTYYINPIYALACANSWITGRNLFARYPFDYLRRFYLSLLRITVPSLRPFIDCVNEGEDYRAIKAIQIDLAEADMIEDWILKFWMLANQKI